MEYFSGEIQQTAKKCFALKRKSSSEQWQVLKGGSLVGNGFRNLTFFC
jgi:hypothetical protein